MQTLKQLLSEALISAAKATLAANGWTDTNRCWNEADQICDGCERYTKDGKLIRLDIGSLEELVYEELVLEGERETVQ